MSTLGLCGAARWQKSQLIKSNMFTKGENAWMEAGVDMTAPCWQTTNVTPLRLLHFASKMSATFNRKRSML